MSRSVRRPSSGSWAPAPDYTISDWEAVLRLAHALDGGGFDEAAALMSRLLSTVDLDTTKELAYLLFSVCQKRGWTSSASVFNGLGTSWSDLRSAARTSPQRTDAQEELDYSDEEEA